MPEPWARSRPFFRRVHRACSWDAFLSYSEFHASSTKSLYFALKRNWWDSLSWLFQCCPSWWSVSFHYWSSFTLSMCLRNGKSWSPECPSSWRNSGLCSQSLPCESALTLLDLSFIAFSTLVESLSSSNWLLVASWSFPFLSLFGAIAMTSYPLAYGCFDLFWSGHTASSR